MLAFFRSRQWVAARRLLLVGIILFLGIRQYGDSLVHLLRRPNPMRDIVITRAEFRPEMSGNKPAWIIGFRNNSDKFAYDQIQLEAFYMDDAGKLLEQDRLVIRQKLLPQHDELVPSLDIKNREGAKKGTLKVLGAQEAK
jgi:hypothetical protein